jgi:translation initiation factor IF-1
MGKGNLISMEGTVIEDLSNNKYKVELDNGFVVTAYIGGKIRINNIRIMVGDIVTVEISPYDVTNGRIVYRKNGK